jgi:hypothetical protein
MRYRPILPTLASFFSSEENYTGINESHGEEFVLNHGCGI